MNSNSDSLTRWWRRISLRAKVTGVTVSVLTIGLFLAGLGTVPWFRQALETNLDQQLTDLASGPVADRFFELKDEPVDTAEGWELKLVAERLTDWRVPRRSEFYVAVYDPRHSLLATAGGDSTFDEPVWPNQMSPADTVVRSSRIFTLRDVNGNPFHAIASYRESTQSNANYIEIVAMPLRSIDNLTRTYLSIFIPVALATILVAALLTRFLVTLTFRRLGRVEQTARAIAGGDLSQRLTDLEPTTEVGQLNYALNTMLDRVDASLAERDRALLQMQRFLGDASHELRTPLVTVRGYADLYRMGAISNPEDVDKAMERIEKEAIRMSVMVDDLLALTRLDEARELKIEPLDLRPIAHDAALDVRVASPERVVTVVEAQGDELSAADIEDAAGPTPIALSWRRRQALRRQERKRSKEPLALPMVSAEGSLPEDARPIVWGEENKVRQVVSNLLGNAQRFSPADSPIEVIVGVDRKARTGWLAVADHGEGVPPQIREQIFQRFWRADTSRTRETGGSGLGLAIVQSIVNNLGGKVAVDETPGGGATFTVSFPLALDAPPAIEPEVDDDYDELEDEFELEDIDELS